MIISLSCVKKKAKKKKASRIACIAHSFLSWKPSADVSLLQCQLRHTRHKMCSAQQQVNKEAFKPYHIMGHRIHIYQSFINQSDTKGIAKTVLSPYLWPNDLIGRQSEVWGKNSLDVKEKDPKYTSQRKKLEKILLWLWRLCSRDMK